MKNLNNNQMRVLATAGVLVIILTSVGLATAGGPRKGRSCGEDGFGPGHRMEMLAKRLDLSEDQQAAIQKIHEKSREVGQEKQKDLMRLRNEMEGEMLKDSPSEKTVLSINSKIGTLKTEMKAQRLKTRLAVREELTAEQRDKMLTMHGKDGKGGRGRGDSCEGPGNKGRHGCNKGQGKGPRNNSQECTQK